MTKTQIEAMLGKPLTELSEAEIRNLLDSCLADLEAKEAENQKLRQEVFLLKIHEDTLKKQIEQIKDVLKEFNSKLTQINALGFYELWVDPQTKRIIENIIA